MSIHVPANAVAAVTHADPYPYYRALAERRTLVYDAQLRLWIAAHPVLVREVLQHPLCRVRPLQEPIPAAIAGAAGAVFGALIRMNDGAAHATGKPALGAVLATITDEMVARATRHVASGLLTGGVFDAARLNAFVLAVPVCTMAHLLGFADGQLADVARWTSAFAACLSPLSASAQIAASHNAASQLLAALRALTQIDDPARLANLLGLLSQSYEATAGLLGNCIVGLLRGAELNDVVAQTMRTDPAIHNTRRYTACEVSIRGVTVPAGQAILLILAADGAALGFGHGMHACPGRRLAHAIVTHALQCLLERGDLPRLTWRYRSSVNARIPEFMEEPA